MSESIAAVSTSVAAFATDRNANHEHVPERIEPTVPETPAAAAPHVVAAPEVALPDDTPDSVMPGTLFAATLFGQRMRTFERAVHALRAGNHEPWSPPESPLRLKDTTV